MNTLARFIAATRLTHGEAARMLGVSRPTIQAATGQGRGRLAMDPLAPATRQTLRDHIADQQADLAAVSASLSVDTLAEPCLNPAKGS